MFYFNDTSYIQHFVAAVQRKRKTTTKKIVIVKPIVCVIDKKYFIFVIYKLNFHQQKINEYQNTISLLLHSINLESIDSLDEFF